MPTLTALENIRLPLDIAGREPEGDWLDQVVDALNLRDRLHAPPLGALGRPAAARGRRPGAGRRGPDIVFADEPTGKLDSQSSAELLDFMRRAADEFGQTIVMVTHEPTAASRADRVLFLADGRIVDQMEDADARVDPRPDEDARGGDEDMIVRQAFRNLLASKLRLFLTSLAVVLGVGFVVGAFVLGDTINKAFDGVFETANEGIAVQVRGVKTVSETDRQPVPESLLADHPRRSRASGGPGGGVAAPAQIIGSDGEPAGHPGPADARVRLVRRPGPQPAAASPTGAPPRAPDDVVIDKTTADDEELRRRRPRSASSPRRARTEYRLVGHRRLRRARTTSPAPPSPPSPPRPRSGCFDSGGPLLDRQRRRREPGVGGRRAGRARSRPCCPPATRPSPARRPPRRPSDQFKQFVDIFRNFLLGFAFIALFVGSFIIFNAFKITVAQRTRQLGLLRAVGASGSQVVRSVLLEAAPRSALVASVIGIVFGIAFAALLRAGFNAIGAALPATTLQVEPRSLIAGLVVGMLVTVVAALVPAWKASRVPPIAAMHDVQVAGSPRRAPGRVGRCSRRSASRLVLRRHAGLARAASPSASA